MVNTRYLAQITWLIWFKIITSAQSLNKAPITFLRILCLIKYFSPFQMGWSQRPKILWSTRQKHKGIHPENIKVDTVLIGEGYKGWQQSLTYSNLTSPHLTLPNLFVLHNLPIYSDKYLSNVWNYLANWSNPL